MATIKNQFLDKDLENGLVPVGTPCNIDEETKNKVDKFCSYQAKLISIPIEEFNKLERIKALYEEALEIVRDVAYAGIDQYQDPRMKWEEAQLEIGTVNKAREFLEKVKAT